MLTPVEIQNKMFKSGSFGYEKKDVDVFMKEIVDSYELLYREKMELSDKVNVLNEGLQYYKSIEKTMQKALILAQKTAEETQENAMRTARNIEKEAQTRAELLLSDAKRELEMVHQRTIQLVQQYEKYKLQFKNLAAAQIELLETDSFQIQIMNMPEVDFPEPTNFFAEVPVPDTEEAPVPEEDFNFTDVASDEK